MHTVFPAAGLGKRLGPLGQDVPKAMVVAGPRPILETLILIFRKIGILDFCAIIGHRECDKQIPQHFKSGEQWGVRVSCLEQRPGIGNSYAVRTASSVCSDEPFFYCDADILFHPSLAESLQQIAMEHPTTSVICCGFDTTIAPTHKKASEFDEFLKDSKQAVATNLSSYSLMGVNYLSTAIHSLLENELSPPSENEVSISSVLLEKCQVLRPRFAFYEGPWWHLAYPEDLNSLSSKLVNLQIENLA